MQERFSAGVVLEATRLKPFFEPQMTGGEETQIHFVIKSNYLNDGPEVKKFEKALAKRIGVEHVICTTSGTAALFLALKAMGVQKHNLVSVSDITFIATANAVSMTGAGVFCGLDATEYLVITHVSGHRVVRLVGNGINCLEDSCEAFPMAPQSRAACYSFSPNKLITTGQGGAVATNDDCLAADIRALKDQGRTAQGTGGNDEHPTIGFNFKMTDLQAAVGLAQLTDLDRRIERRREMQKMYDAELPVLPFKADEVPLWTDMIHDDREAIIARVEAAGYECRRFWKPLSQQPPYLDPTMKTDTSKMFWLPSSFQMSNEDVKKVIAAVQGD